MIKFVIFDVGGILFQKGPPRLAVKLARDILGNLSNKGEVEYEKKRLSMQTGRVNTRDFFLYLIKKYSLKKTIDQIENGWLSVYKKYAFPCKSIVDLIRILKNKYKVVGFSNTIDLHGEYNKKVGNYDILDKVFLSYEMGFRKPDREAYEFVLNSLRAKPEECLFIDDREENIVAAEGLGIKSIKFDSNKQLKDSLKKLGFS